MMATLNLFPARVAIGTADVDGIEVPVLMTPEFFRALSDLLQRVGGPAGTATSDIEEMALQSLTPVVDMSAFSGLDALQTVDSIYAANAAMQAASDALALQIEQAGALLADIRRRCDDLEILAGYRDPYRVDWERPGSIGSLTPGSGTFTSLTYNGALNGGSGAFTTISASGQITSTVVTGTAPLVIASTTKVSNLNVDSLDGGDWAAPGAIGATTPNTGVFTTLRVTNEAGGSATQAIFLHDATGNYAFGMGPTSTEGYINYDSGTAGTASFGHRFRVNGTDRLTIDGTNQTTINGKLLVNSTVTCPGGATFLTTNTALTNGAGAGAGTITNAPAGGNPTKWIGINDNGTTRYIPAW